MVRWALLMGLTACTADDSDSEPVDLPEDTWEPDDTDVDWQPIDTGSDGPTDETPAHTLTLHQWGHLFLDDAGANGRLRVREYVDGAEPQVDTAGDLVDTDAEPLDCDLDFGAAGPVADATCDGCDAAYDLTLIRVSGDAAGCRDPFLPMDGDVQRLALHPGRGILLRHNPALDVWVDWFAVVPPEPPDPEDPPPVEEPPLRYEWRATVGVAIEDMEDE